VGTNIPSAYLDFVNRFGSTVNDFPLTVGWARDTRDSALVPTDGRYQRFNGEWSPGGQARYVKASYQFQQYIPLNKQFSLAFNTEAGWGKGLNGQSLPLFKNFYGGGLGSVRGFQQGTLGGTSTLVNPTGTQLTTTSYIGGNRKLVLNAEVGAPFPGAGNDRTLRMFGFFDIGNVWGEGEQISTASLRASTGVGISWISPLGPLKIALAKPVRKQPGDLTQTIQFQIGTAF